MDLAALLRRRRRWLLLLAAAGATGYGAYKVYHLPSVSRTRKQLAKLLGALTTAADAVSSSADVLNLVSSDLHRFLCSDSDQIPQSLTQISKIASSDEFLTSVSRVSAALTSGISRGLQSGSETRVESTFSNRALDKLFSDAGSGFASAVVGSFARNLVLAFYSVDRTAGTQSDSATTPRWVTLICGNECRELIADSIQRFVSTAVAVYLDKTMNVNTYDELFAGMTNPKHEPKVKDMLVSVCNGAVETLVTTSHRVLTSPEANNRDEDPEQVKESSEEQHTSRRSSFDLSAIDKGGGWIDQVSTTLAVPSNRRFVLDVTGRMTFETVRSFLEFVMWKLHNGTRRGVDVVREEIVGRGLEVVRYFSAKSVVIFTICIALCMHVLTGARVLMPA